MLKFIKKACGFKGDLVVRDILQRSHFTIIKSQTVTGLRRQM